jgi:hypothetical protein
MFGFVKIAENHILHFCNLLEASKLNDFGEIELNDKEH